MSTVGTHSPSCTGIVLHAHSICASIDLAAYAEQRPKFTSILQLYQTAGEVAGGVMLADKELSMT